MIPVKICNHVYAVLGLHHPWGVNAGFIVTDEGIIVIDAGWTYYSALTMLGYIKAVAGNKPIKYLIWTEHHSDHIFGSIVFVREGAKIIAHKNAYKHLREVGGIKGYVEFMRRRINERYKDLVERGYDIGSVMFEGVEDVWPDILIDSEYTLKLGRIEVKLIPTPGHTPSNIVVYVPKCKVLFAGDTIYSGYPPNTRFSTPELIKEWVRVLDRLYELDINVIIPGHGPPCSKDEIKRNMAILKRIIREGV
ncbi:MAG: hypothetical protein DRN15_08820 [Thermoprotei archaeon]|nr:MAG: hypothetical protein DRN15_08820 [Thermoprotei archaeon]